MAFEIYWGSGSPYSWRVLLGFEIKGVAYESKLLQFSKREHQTPQFLALNHRGKVPVLKNGATVIYESMAILAYLEREHPEPPLFGHSPEETGQIWQTIFELVHYVFPYAEDIVLPLFAGEITDKTDTIQASAEVVRTEFTGIDQRLAQSPYLVGDTISAADVVFFPAVQVLQRALGKEAAASLNLKFLPLKEHYPHIAAWVARIEALPGYDKTYPPHWRN